MDELSAHDMIRYAAKNVSFYSKEQYSKAAEEIEKGTKLEDILRSLPLIDGGIFIGDYNDLIPSKKTPITVYFSSGSTGKPKPIPRTYDQDADYATTFVNEILDKLVLGGMDIELNKGPPAPAISGRAMSLISNKSDSIEISQGPGQNMVDILKVIEKLNNSHSKNIVVMGFPSAIFREIYDMKDADRNYLKTAINNSNIYMITGGENLPYQRAKLLYSLFPTNITVDFIGSSEGVAAYRTYTKDELTSDAAVNKPFRFLSYNNLFMINTKINGIEKLLSPAEAVGLEGELVITTKARKGAEYVPLINYNTKDTIKVVGVADNGDILGYYIGRSDGIKRFGVGKLVEEMVADTISDLINRFKVGEGYSVMTRESELDRLTFYIDKGQFNGDKEDLIKTIKGYLSSKQMEIAYSIDKGMATIDVELLNKDSIPFYKDRGKSKWLIDKREV